MKKPLDFYFDFSSPYAYLAAMRIDELAAKYDRQVEWHPILLGVVFKETGAIPLLMIPMKGPYVIHDLERTARFHNIPYQLPNPCPIMTHIAARAMLSIRAMSGASEAVAFARAVFQAYFVEDIHIGEQENVLRIASNLGLDVGAIAAAINGPEIKEQLKNENEAAIRLGVFGAPFIIVDGEAYWGFDRFDQIEKQLQQVQ